MTGTAVVNPSWTSILSTATWASAYYSAKSAESPAGVVAARYNQTTIGIASTITAALVAPTSTPEYNTSMLPLNRSWIAGPVIGSILGMGTVFVVIYFTRRTLSPLPSCHNAGPSCPNLRTRIRLTPRTHLYGAKTRRRLLRHKQEYQSARRNDQRRRGDFKASS